MALLRRLLKFYKHPLEFPGASELPDSACEHWLNWWEEGVALVEFEAAAEGSQDGGGEERLLVLGEYSPSIAGLELTSPPFRRRAEEGYLSRGFGRRRRILWRA